MSSDRGSATVWVLGLVALVLACTELAIGYQSALLARHRLAGAADLVALAGAGAIGTGRDPCATARLVASRNHAQLAGCVAELDVTGRSGTCAVRLAADAQLPIIGRRTVRANAKAARLPPVGR